MRGDIEDIAEQCDEMEKADRLCDVVIDNIEMPTNVEDSDNFFKTFVNKTLMGEVIGEGELIKTSVYRKRGSNKVTIIGKLKNLATKIAILKQKKMFIQKGVYAKENLTPRKFQLFKDAKEFAKRTGAKFVWTRSGDVFVRFNENSNPVLIRNRLVLYGLHA